MKKSSFEKRHLVYKKYKGRCAYCGSKIEYKDMQVDHIIPKYRGSDNTELKVYGIKKGTDNLENLNPSCGSCNSSKSTFTIEKWRNELSLKAHRIKRDSSTFRILERFGIVKVINTDILFHFEKINKNG